MLHRTYLVSPGTWEWRRLELEVIAAVDCLKPCVKKDLMLLLEWILPAHFLVLAHIQVAVVRQSWHRRIDACDADWWEDGHLGKGALLVHPAVFKSWPDFCWCFLRQTPHFSPKQPPEFFSVFQFSAQQTDVQLLIGSPMEEKFGDNGFCFVRKVS